MIKRHWTDILAFIHSRISSALVEGLTSKMKTAPKPAYRFKTSENYRAPIYLVPRKLRLASATHV